MKLAVQLVKPATAIAEGLGPCENNSATMNQGMGPGPISKNATKAKMATMLKYDIHLSWSYKNRGGSLLAISAIIFNKSWFVSTITKLKKNKETYQQSQGYSH